VTAFLLVLFLGSVSASAQRRGGGRHGISGWPPAPWDGTQDNGVSSVFRPHGGSAADNELPPGAFSDGRKYKLADFKGKVLVLFYFDPASTKSLQTLKDRLDAAKVLSARPVKLLGIAKGDPGSWPATFHAGDVPFPVYADNLAVFGELYGTRYSFGCRVFDADGSPSDWQSEFADIDSAADKAKWTWKSDDYPKQLSRVLDLLEWNQFEPAMKQLKSLRHDTSKSVADAAEKLYAAVRTTATEWKKDADKQAADKPVAAYDLYLKVSLAFGDDEAGKSALDAANGLKTNKVVAAELAARDLMAKVATALANMKLAQISQVSDMLAQIRQKCADAPTAVQAQAIEHVLNGTP
jgi:hypothetical protein